MIKNKIDKKLLGIVLILLIFGVIMVYSSSWPYAIDIGKTANYFAIRQMIFAFIGIIIMLIASFVDYHIYKKLSILIYILTFFICLLVFTPLGSNYDTFARRWINIRGIGFMPSDLMKISSVILMSTVLSVKKRTKNNLTKGFIPILLIIMISVLPVYLQPNLSTTITIAMSLGAIYFMSGMDLRYFLFIIPAVVLSVIFFFIGEDNKYRIQRVKTFLNPLADFQHTGWQLSQALFAVSSGGLFGLGLGKSRQKFLYLSESHNDFIFAIIAEELGFIGSIIIIFLFLMFIKRGFEISIEAKDEFGKLLGSGITVLIGLQAFINIGVAFGLLPPTGLALPFVSYGGTSLVVTLGMVGILLNISRNKINKRGRA